MYHLKGKVYKLFFKKFIGMKDQEKAKLNLDRRVVNRAKDQVLKKVIHQQK